MLANPARMPRNTYRAQVIKIVLGLDVAGSEACGIVRRRTRVPGPDARRSPRGPDGRDCRRCRGWWARLQGRLCSAAEPASMYSYKHTYK